MVETKSQKATRSRKSPKKQVKGYVNHFPYAACSSVTLQVAMEGFSWSSKIQYISKRHRLCHEMIKAPLPKNNCYLAASSSSLHRHHCIVIIISISQHHYLTRVLIKETKEESLTHQLRKWRLIRQTHYLKKKKRKQTSKEIEKNAQRKGRAREEKYAATKQLESLMTRFM